MFQSDFPLLLNHPGLVYLDSASTAQKPKIVQDAIWEIMKGKYANIHRGSYILSEMSETLYEASKDALKIMIGAESRHEIIYTYNATYASNLLARSLVKSGLLTRGDKVLLSLLEHHANIVPWQIMSEEYGIVIEWVGVTHDGRIDYEDLERKLPWARLVSLTAASNVTGSILDFTRVQWLLDACEQRPIFVVDASQGLPHFSLEVAHYGIDFLFATGHKFMTDTGIGFLYGKKEHLKKMNPALCWGWAINWVTENGYEAAGLPYRFEPGTPHIIGAASVLAAAEYIESIGGYSEIEKYENSLVVYALEKIRELPPSVKLIGPKDPKLRLWVFSFAFEQHHPRDIADVLAEKNICVRAGHHCTEPLHHHYGLPATLRMSLYIYNTKADIDAFFTAFLESIKR